jgi:hypothetical protein
VLIDNNLAEMPVGVVEKTMPVGHGRPAVDAGLAHTGYRSVRRAQEPIDAATTGQPGRPGEFYCGGAGSAKEAFVAG